VRTEKPTVSFKDKGLEDKGLFGCCGFRKL
jgi:hypothetical protein